MLQLIWIWLLICFWDYYPFDNQGKWSLDLTCQIWLSGNNEHPLGGPYILMSKRVLNCILCNYIPQLLPHLKQILILFACIIENQLFIHDAILTHKKRNTCFILFEEEQMQWIEYNGSSKIISYQKYFFLIQQGLLNRNVCIVSFVYLLVVLLLLKCTSPVIWLWHQNYVQIIKEIFAHW